MNKDRPQEMDSTEMEPDLKMKILDLKTGADGTVRVPKQDKEPKWLCVTKGEDQHLMRFDSERGQIGRAHV